MSEDLETKLQVAVVKAANGIYRTAARTWHGKAAELAAEREVQEHTTTLQEYLTILPAETLPDSRLAMNELVVAAEAYASELIAYADMLKRKLQEAGAVARVAS